MVLTAIKKCMTPVVSAAVIAGFALAGCSATTDTARQDMVNERQLAGVTADGERVECRRIRETGTRFSTRVCHTEEQWARIAEDSRREIEDGRGRSQSSLNDPGQTVDSFGGPN